ncbi:MAG: hypothetical protein OWQ57_03005, partial [Sulfobacillus sp.]|nr:hypothetical protein [Sulfobacillus sp.]
MHQPERYASIRTLEDAGYRVAEIVRKTGYDCKTVTQYLTAGASSANPWAPYPHRLDDFIPLLERLWTERTRTAKAVWKTLQQAGYRGSLSTVSRWLRNRRSRDQTAQPAPPRRITRRTGVTGFMVSSTVWPRQATAVLSELLASAPVYRHVWTRVHQFHILLTHRRGPALPGRGDEWCAGACALCEGVEGRHRCSPGGRDGALESRHDGRLQQ